MVLITKVYFGWLSIPIEIVYLYSFVPFRFRMIFYRSSIVDPLRSDSDTKLNNVGCRHLNIILFVDTVYPKKYAHGFVVLCFVVVMQSFIMNSHEVFIHIHQCCFAGTGAIVRLPQCQWSKPDGYGKINQCITTTKHSKAKTVCIFLGIYCRSQLLWTNKIWFYGSFLRVAAVLNFIYHREVIVFLLLRTDREKWNKWNVYRLYAMKHAHLFVVLCLMMSTLWLYLDHGCYWVYVFCKICIYYNFLQKTLH